MGFELPRGFKNSLIRVILLCGLIVFCSVFLRNGPNIVKRWNTHPIFNKDGHSKETTKLIISNATYLSKKVADTVDTGLVFCNDTRLMAAGTFPPIALASFPGSGNTWVRHLIETATGYATGSVYDSNILAKQGFIGEKMEAMSGKALTIKTHTFVNSMVGAVLLVRNPYRALIAEFNREKAGKTRMAQEKMFKTPEWHEYVKRTAGLWIKLNQGYISHCHLSGTYTCKSVLVVYYEQLQDQLIKELRRILEYISLNEDQERLACVLANAEGAFHRPKRNQTFDPFSEEDRRLVDGYMQTYCDMIDKEGLETPPLSFTSYPGGF